MSSELSKTTKLPKNIFHNIFAFPPNKDTLGGTAYLIADNHGNILVDSPNYDRSCEEFIEFQGGIKYICITHRGAISKNLTKLQEKFDCTIFIQEQEGYLLPSSKIATFQDRLTLDSRVELIWTPGHSPGSSCFYYQGNDGVLFTGRSLLPLRDAKSSTVKLLPIKTATTFHWGRQIKSIKLLKQNFSQQNLNYICPGAHTGYLRGKGYLENGLEFLSNIDLAELSEIN